MLFVFDWDGTLSDSTSKIVGCMHEAASDHGLPRLEDYQVQDIIGLGLPEAIKTLYPQLETAGVEAMRASYSAIFTAADQQPSSFFPNVEVTLDELLHRGHNIAVATGKSRAGLNRVLHNLKWKDYFHSTRCADETASKPHPKMLHELQREFAVDLEQMVMVGDTEFDMEMARRAGVPKVAVDYGAHHVDRLRPYDPVLCVSDFGEILSLG